MTQMNEQAICDKCRGSGIEDYINHHSLDDFEVEPIRCEKCDGCGYVYLDEASPNNAVQVPDGYVLVPIEPTPEMLDVAVSHALMVSLSGNYNWSAYMRDVWLRMVSAAEQSAPVGEAEPVTARDWLLTMSACYQCALHDAGDRYLASYPAWTERVETILLLAQNFHLGKRHLPTHPSPTDGELDAPRVLASLIVASREGK